MAPFDLNGIIDTAPYYLIFFTIGIAFGAVLEMSGFGDSRKLAAQFYLKDMTVLKVMFTAIIVTCVLVFGASGLGLLDYSLVWVNPTYLIPGVVGGLIMGVGFIVGGFCPGTSLVAAGTLKMDGIAFVGGVGLGTLLFSETEFLIRDARNATYMGRFTLPEMFGLPEGVVVVMLISMALLMFYGAELAERHFGQGKTIDKASLIPTDRRKMIAAGTLLGAAVLVAVIGQPQAEDRWERVADDSGISLDNRDPFVHPAEVVEWREDTTVYVSILDVRPEGDFNQFHILGATRVDLHQLEDTHFIKSLKNAPPNTLTFVVSNGEDHATVGWQRLMGSGVANVYIIEGGINKWLQVYTPDPCVATPVDGRTVGSEELAWTFAKAVGDDCYSAHPEAMFKEHPTDCYLKAHPELKNRPANEKVARPVPFNKDRDIKFIRKVKMKKATAAAGGCG